VFAGGIALASEHSGELRDAIFFLQQVDFGNRPAAFDFFRYHIMSVGRSRHLWQMRDAKDLPLIGNLPHFLADRVGGLDPEVCIHLVKDQHRNLILDGQNGFEGEHHAGEFTGGSDGTERPGWFARVGSELKLDLVQAR